MELEVTSGITINMNYGAILLPQDPLKHTSYSKGWAITPKI